MSMINPTEKLNLVSPKQQLSNVNAS